MASLLSVAMILILVSLSTTTSWASYCPGGYFTPGSPYSSSLKAVATILPRRVGSSPLLFVSESITSRGGGEVYAFAQCWRGSSSPLLFASEAITSREGGEVTHSRNAGEALRAQYAKDVLLRLLEMQGLFVSPGRTRLYSVISAP